MLWSKRPTALTKRGRSVSQPASKAAQKSGNANIPALALERSGNPIPVYIFSNFTIVAAIYGAVTFTFFHPFHMWETAIYIMGMACPGLLAVFFAVQVLLTRMRMPGWAPEWTAIYVTLGAASFIIGTIFIINMALDRSAGEGRTLVIEDKSQNYFAWFPIPAASPLSFQFSPLQNVMTDKATYNGIVPGISVIQVVVHKGSLGFPWYERHYYISNPVRGS